MRRPWFNALIWLLLAAYTLYMSVGPLVRQTVVACKFQPQPSATALRFASRTLALRGISIEGTLSGKGEHGLYHYDGAARISGDDKADGGVSGLIFLAEDGAVTGFGLWITHPAFGQDQLSVATLNSDGFLDVNRSTAFLFANRTDKFSYPVSFHCRSERNYNHIYQRLTSFSWVPLMALLFIAWAVLFFAKRKAEQTEFGER